MEISKSAVLLANEHRSNQKNVTNDFRMNFRYVFVHAKTTLSMECQKNVASRKHFTKMTASVYHRILSNIKTSCRFKSPIYGYLLHEEAD